MVDFLNDLPFIPKRLLFRYMDTATLKQVRLTSSTVYHFVKSMCKTEIGSMRIMENINATTNAPEYCVQLVKSKLQCGRYYYARKFLVRSTDMASFLYWLTSSHTEIELFELHNCRFHSNGVDHIPPPSKKSNFRTKRVSIWCVTFSEQDPDGISRMLEYLKPEEMQISGCKQDEIRKLLSPYFYQRVFPSLNELMMKPGDKSHFQYREEEFLSHVDRFPARLSYTYPHIFPFEAVRRAIHTWWKGESEIHYWTIQIRSEYYLDIELLATRLGLPYRLGWQQNIPFGGPYIRSIELCRPMDKKQLIILPPPETYPQMCSIATAIN